jgi:hypothetical protein
VGFLLSLRNSWFGCIVRHSDGPLRIARAELPIADGMSGSPFFDEAGRAIDVWCVSSDTRNRTEGGSHSQLMDSLPCCFFGDCRHKAATGGSLRALTSGGCMSKCM